MGDDLLSALKALGEGFTTEFKSSVPSNLGAEICAFANATGGMILLGVADDGDIVGIGNHNRLKSQVQTTARSADPPIAVEVESVGDLLRVTVARAATASRTPSEAGSTSARAPIASGCPGTRSGSRSTG